MATELRRTWHVDWRLARRIIEAWRDDGGPTLLALDAPPGWPVPLSRELAIHTADAPSHAPADEMANAAAIKVYAAATRRAHLEASGGATSGNPQ